MQLAVIDPVTHRWTGEWGPTVKPYVAPTLANLRATSRYHVVRDAQLKRDLKGRTLADVYRDNRVGRTTYDGHYYSPLFGKYEPRTNHGPSIATGPYTNTSLEAEYLAWCKARNHTPHPASIDSDHPMHAGQRERCPKRETINA